MSDSHSHSGYEPHPTAAMDRQHPNLEASYFNEDEVVHIDLVGKRKVYSEAAYNKLLAKRDRLRKALEWYEKIVGECNRRGQEGEDARNALAQDVGSKAHTALQEDRDE